MATFITVPLKKSYEVMDMVNSILNFIGNTYGSQEDHKRAVEEFAALPCIHAGRPLPHRGQDFKYSCPRSPKYPCACLCVYAFVFGHEA
uniref:Uncharacterized protein n=1 Tax=Eptatretus burgeri TaxID=7764 RepID=A0A8C4Q7L9_EPTBU